MILQFGRGRVRAVESVKDALYIAYRKRQRDVKDAHSARRLEWEKQRLDSLVEHLILVDQISIADLPHEQKALLAWLKRQIEKKLENKPGPG